ncbi:hypothetical protein Pmani_011970 [Petrolisthes manimaculis]|uniref:Uncharacterized protein n=1 Tax=Petrolisthes manimaculis TaxID=1843537 RepID=A0AAE1UAY4_9EUCA|nr:hypothetical protein Pmani_011970 [Petrolisthes manimaculis]
MVVVVVVPQVRAQKKPLSPRARSSAAASRWGRVLVPRQRYRAAVFTHHSRDIRVVGVQDLALGTVTPLTFIVTCSLTSFYQDAFVSSLLIGRQPGRCLVIGWLRREKRGHVTRRVARVVRATTNRKALAKDAESPVAGAWVPANSLRQIAATQRFISL